MTEAPPPPRWLLLIHQIPPRPNYLRVKFGRQLQKVGAVALKNSVYVLPRSEQHLETFEWIGQEIRRGGGEATICESQLVGGVSDRGIEDLFNRARTVDYESLLEDARSLRKTLGRKRRRSEDTRAEAAVALAKLRRRLAEVETLDFFGAMGREPVVAVLEEIERLIAEGAPSSEPPAPEPTAPRGALWVTRQGVHVDRMASAWLIRRRIDPDARFKFVPAKGYVPQDGELRFDMFEAEFTHEGDLCTFEVLLKRFGLEGDPALASIAQIVHFIDVRDGRGELPERAGVERVINGIAAGQPDDEARLGASAVLFDALAEAFRKRRTA
jgi:hypothetical protein